MRMGGNTGIERLILSVMLLSFSGMALAQPAFNPAPAPSTAPSIPPAANSGAMSAANDAEFAKVARATAVTNAAEQSSFGKVMSRIFSKRALAAGLRGTPQAVAVGLALEAAMSYFSSDDKAGSPDVSTGSFSGSETWANALLNKGLIATSDVEVHAFEENKNIQLTTSGYVEKLNGKFYLTTADGSIVTDNFGSIVLFDSAPLKPVFITVPDTVEPYAFTPSPVYRMDNFSCPSDVYRSGSTESGDGYKFSAQSAHGYLFSNNLTALTACVFHDGEKSNSEIVSFSVSGYDADIPLPFGYSLTSKMQITYDYKENYFNPASNNIEYRIVKRVTERNISLTPSFEKKIVPRVLPDYVVSQQAEKITEPLPAMKDVVNNVMMHSASQPDYQGVPFSPSSPVTVEEFQQAAEEAAVPLTKGMLYQQINYYPPPVGVPSGESVPVFNPAQRPDDIPQGNNPSSYPSFLPNTQSAPQVDTSHPGIGEPSLDNPPDGKQILAPLLTLFPFVKNFTLPVRSVQCPVAEFDAFEKHYVIDSHCALLEKNRALFALIAGVVWAFLSLRIILSA